MLRAALRVARVAVAALLAITVLALPARAQTLIRDADIEYALRQIASPVLTAAGLNPAQVRVLVVADSTLNAFVVDSRHILIHSGLILRMNRAEELQAVLAHEAAHIANGHIARRATNMRNARNTALFGLILSGVAAAAGNTSAAGGIALGSASSASRVFLSHTRAEEASADQAAMRYMANRGIDVTAMSDVLDIFRGQEALSVGRQDPYVRSHPLTRDRMRAVDGFAAAYGGTARDDPNAQYWFGRTKAKLGAFLQSPGYTLRRIDRGDDSDLAILARAVAYHRTPDPQRAIAEIGKLIARRPNDPFLRDLQGQILLESRQTGAAVNAYRQAVALGGNDPQILAGLGRAYLAIGSRDADRAALQALESSFARDPYDPRMLRDLAVAYAKAGNNGMASVATAERYALTGRLDTAATHAQRAEGLLPQGSSGWNRALDVLNAAKQAGIGR
ncbi:M48 family metalloprotease [Anianabacter salinae]|uniref:M48 family metalloprotease n=1 Tax=Anianabacter salinae TaxID=2851023 RepID=UPI00225DE56D|nr:M48 family metalloprotease [Anianabacter salinae]MBV0911680.1 M48 family metalloprotease [Anianabacter salinae]